MSKKIKFVNIIPGAANMVVRAFEKYAALLDGPMMSTDQFGKDVPSRGAGVIVYTTASLAQQVWRQMHGDIGKAWNASTRLANARTELKRIADRFGDDTDSRDVDPLFIRQAYEVELAQEAFDCLEGLLHEFMEAYTHYTGQQWEPYVAGPTYNAGSKEAPKRAYSKDALAKMLA
jgi:hypothetical protein